MQLAPKSSTQLEITWEAPILAHWNSEHLSYKVGYKYVIINSSFCKVFLAIVMQYCNLFCLNFREVGETTGFTYIDLHPSNELAHRFVLQTLQKFTSYQIVIQAYNQQGLGPASEASLATTLEDGKELS